MRKLDTIFSFIVTVIFVQTLFFKFTGAAESVWIFETIGIEPWGRFLTGGIELITSTLLLRKSSRTIGALLGWIIMSGALLSHIFILGVVIQNDGGLLFSLCLVCLGLCSVILYNHRKEIPLRLFSAGLIICVPMIAQAKVSYNSESEYGIHGYDAVSYLTHHQAREGKKELKYEFDGITYLFESQENLEKFKKNPGKYIPAYGGWCAYAMADGEKVDIDPNTFKIIDGKTYLFYNGLWGNTLTKWQGDEKNLKEKADSSWKRIIK